MALFIMLINNVGLPGEMCCRGDFSPPRSLRRVSAGLRERVCRHARLPDPPRAVTPLQSTLSREVKPQRCAALGKPSTNTGVFLCLWPSLPLRVLLFSQMLFLYLQRCRQCWPLPSWTAAASKTWSEEPGVGRPEDVGMFGYLSEKSLGTHTHCFLCDAA